MSANKHTPGTGIHPEDLNALTEKWHRDTNSLNGSIDSYFKSAQDDAYARGYRRGREDLISIREQRDELLAALEKVTAKLAWLNSDDCGHIMALTDEAEALIASVKGGA